jgi:hypothetical protein
MRTSYLASMFYQGLTRVDALYDEIQNAAYSYSESLWSRDVIDEEDDATFARLVQTEEALPGSNSSCQGLHRTNWCGLLCIRAFVDIS